MPLAVVVRLGHCRPGRAVTRSTPAAAADFVARGPRCLNVDGGSQSKGDRGLFLIEVDDGSGFRPATAAEVDSALRQRQLFGAADYPARNLGARALPRPARSPCAPPPAGPGEHRRERGAPRCSTPNSATTPSS